MPVGTNGVLTGASRASSWGERELADCGSRLGSKPGPVIEEFLRSTGGKAIDVQGTRASLERDAPFGALSQEQCRCGTTGKRVNQGGFRLRNTSKNTRYSL
jgi:hypothetical protein